MKEWERVKLSYEILSDRKRRLRYDRTVAMSDPSALMMKTANELATWGLEGMGKSAFEVCKGVGVLVVGNIKKEITKTEAISEKI